MPRLLPSAKGLCLNCLGFYSINTNVSTSLHILTDKNLLALVVEPNLLTEARFTFDQFLQNYRR
ncbi:hypothetical protein CCHR01_11433 [Colletotrichum chrysophilum]|uniref:Uncharacterized protein n=1 Tax=Colletotrichum chrysophilum TaxID=1836956 RepID=A0AAD9EID8_9PEZI|nr:hypothetical protein CCHR01_11433 [Colletotrichum chrysophilum]